MTNDEIIQAVAIKKSEKRKKAIEEKEAKRRDLALREQGLTPDGKPIGGKGHPGYFKGKKIDRDKFQQAIDACFGGLAMTKAYKISGLSYPTFQKRILELGNNGFLPADLFTDNKPFVFNYTPPSELAMIEKEIKRVEKMKAREK